MDNIINIDTSEGGIPEEFLEGLSYKDRQDAIIAFKNQFTGVHNYPSDKPEPTEFDTLLRQADVDRGYFNTAITVLNDIFTSFLGYYIRDGYNILMYTDSKFKLMKDDKNSVDLINCDERELSLLIDKLIYKHNKLFTNRKGIYKLNSKNIDLILFKSEDKLSFLLDITEFTKIANRPNDYSDKLVKLVGREHTEEFIEDKVYEIVENSSKLINSLTEEHGLDTSHRLLISKLLMEKYSKNQNEDKPNQKSNVNYNQTITENIDSEDINQ